MVLDHRSGPFVRGVLLVVPPALIAGWYLVRGRVRAMSTLAEQTPPVGAQSDPDE